MRALTLVSTLLVWAAPCFAAPPAAMQLQPAKAAAIASAPAVSRARTGFGQAIAELTRSMQPSRTTTAPPAEPSKGATAPAKTADVASADATSL